MKRETPPFRTDHVGSLLRPAARKWARASRDRGDVAEIPLREIEDAAAEAARSVDANQLCLSPQCGFASTEEGYMLTEVEQWAKPACIVETASRVWGE